MIRLYGYLVKTRHFAIRYRTKEPDYSHLTKQEHEWTRSVYGNVKEAIPKDIPKPLGKRVITTTFLDANLLHDIVTERSVSAVLHFVNTTPMDRFLWRQQHMVQSLEMPKQQQSKHGPQKHTKICRCPHHDQCIHVW